MKQGRAAHFLWPHERLLFVSQMVERMRPILSPLEVDFVRPESERFWKKSMIWPPRTNNG